MSRRAAARLLLTQLATTKTTTPPSTCGGGGGRLLLPPAHNNYYYQQHQGRGMSALSAAGAGVGRRPLLPHQRRPPPTTPTARAPPPTLLAAASSPLLLGPAQPQPPSPALLLDAARVARHRAAAAGGAWSAAAAATTRQHHHNHHHQRSGPAPLHVASPAPSSQALFGTGDEFDDDGEPRPRGDDEVEGDVAAAAAATATAAAAATAATTLPPLSLGGGAARAYSSSSTSAPPPTPDPNAATSAAAAAAATTTTPKTPTPRRGDDGEEGDANESDDEGGVGSELHAVNTAIRANALIFLAKLAVALASSSAAMFAEAVHSLVDVANQTLLRVGILKARRAPTEAHPLGFARDQFIWPLISAVGIFCCGAGVSLVHGVAGFFEPARELGDLTASYAVLGVSLALESHSLLVALRTLQSRAKKHGLSLVQYLRTGADPAATAVMMEDGAAVAGLLVAGGCLALCQITGSAVWDSAGSVAVALLLGGVAVTLIQRNRLFLIGRAMPPEAERRVLGYLESDPVIRRVRNARSEELGVRAYRFYGEIAFDGGEMARRCLDRVGRRRLFGALAAAAAARDATRMDALMTAYSAAVVSATGAEVDRLERQISALVPGVKHVDLETDREAAGPLVGRRRDGAAGAAPAAYSSADDDLDGGVRLLLEASSSPSPPEAGEAEEARLWLARQLPPDGSVEARRARPSMSAAAYREREQMMAKAAEKETDVFLADALKAESVAGGGER
jgi:zinc transporter 9